MMAKKQRIKQKNSSLTFSDHLAEFKTRLIICFLFFITGSMLGYLFNQQILEIIIKPLNQPVFYTSPSGGFQFIFQSSLFFGLLISLPVFVYQAIRFIEPALPKKYPKLIFIITANSVALLILGVVFAYFVSLPAALYFLNKFSNDQIQSLISTKEYFTFVTRYLIGFGLIFQLPLIMFAINSIQKISTKKLLSQEKWLILISVILAGILTPTPDILNQLIMALPIILLYQLTILLLWIVNRKKFLY